MNAGFRARPGVALMLVLWIIVILAGVCSTAALTTRTTLRVAANYRAQVVARYAAESGVTAAVSTVEDRLGMLTDTAARRDYLNHLERALPTGDQLSLGDGRLAVTLIDPGARLDANAADEKALSTLFSFLTDAASAARAARSIQDFLGGGRGAEAWQPPMETTPETGLQTVRTLRSLDELARIPGVPPGLAERAAEFLTIDGDGTINRATAPDIVLAAAGGEVRDEPTRILVVSRGWLDGHALSHEIQAVYAVNGRELTLVRWRERDL